MKKFIFCLLAASLLSFSVFAGDTGTYRLTDYRVKLTPTSDGKVQIDYFQEWLVTSGHIPWITVGTPNDHYEITTFGGAVKQIAPANGSGWSGVKIDLDQDYQPSQSFAISFSIAQNNLFYADEENYKLDFAPGWYDRAYIDTLTISVRFFAKLDSVKADPPPSLVSDEEMIWKKTDLGKGERFSISVSFPKNLFPAEMNKGNLQSTIGIGEVILIIFLIVIVVVVIIAFASLGSGGGYSGGGVFYGGSGGRGRGGVSPGGGGGLGGRSSSCACACVACACACACAGGGGAGCDRKKKHSCPVCRGGKS